MGRKEGLLIADIQMALANERVRLFRNQVGQYEWAPGKWIRYGLCKGSSDLIGWVPVTVTEGMVGETLALFCAVEVKTAGVEVTSEQAHFIETINRAGGIAGVAHSLYEARLIFEHIKRV
jgi:hypothetical protein